MRNRLAHRTIGMLAIFVLNIALAEAQSPAQNQKASAGKTATAAASGQLPVLGGGTLGRLTKWTGFTSTNSAIGDTSIFEDKSGNVGIGTDTPVSKLSVAGTIQTTLGGLKFPDGTLQTSAALSLGSGPSYTSSGTNIADHGNATFTRDEGDPARFSLDELSLLVSWDPLPSIHLLSELEGEDLATIDDEGHGGLVDAHFTVERLYGDVAVTDWLQLRAGKFLTPVGRWNVIHAAPLVWTTSRPLVTKLTFDPHTTGGMVFGSLEPLLRDGSYELFGQFTDQFAPAERQRVRQCHALNACDALCTIEQGRKE